MDGHLGYLTASSNITTQEWNQITRAETTINLDKATQKDGSQMRSIALLTMIFLPGIFVAVSLRVMLLRAMSLAAPKLQIYTRWKGKKVTLCHNSNQYTHSLAQVTTQGTTTINTTNYLRMTSVPRYLVTTSRDITFHFRFRRPAVSQVSNDQRTT